MRLVAAFLLSALSLFAADPPKIPSPGSPFKIEGPVFLTSPNQANEPPVPPSSWPLTIKQFRWLYIDEKKYTGPVTFDGADNPAVKIFPAKAGVSYPGWKEGDADWNEHVPPVSKNEVFFVGGKSKGIVNIVAWGIADSKPVKLGVMTLNVGGAPPVPDVDPVTPTDNTSPFKESGFRVLMIFNSNDTTRPPSDQSVINGKAVRDYLKAKCVASPVGTSDGDGKEYRIWPANSDVSGARAVWKDAFALKKEDDWILIGDGKTGYSGPRPKNEADALALLKKYGGE